MLVRAVEACIVSGQRRRVGDEFDYTLAEGQASLPPCVVEIKKRSEVVKDEGEKPIALSEIAKSASQARSFVETVSKKKTGPEK